MMGSAGRALRARPIDPEYICSERLTVSNSLVGAFLRLPYLAAEQGREHDNRKSERKPQPNPKM
jgi:hypothetical protein